MNEMYWITRIALIGEFFEWALIIVCFTSVMMVILCPLVLDVCKELLDITQISIKKALRLYLFVVFFILIGRLFIPNGKEMLTIYGIGGTIDYIKNNKKALQLTDECIDALTRYVDSVEKEIDEK